MGIKFLLNLATYSTDTKGELAPIRGETSSLLVADRTAKPLLVAAYSPPPLVSSVMQSATISFDATSDACYGKGIEDRVHALLALSLRDMILALLLDPHRRPMAVVGMEEELLTTLDHHSIHMTLRTRIYRAEAVVVEVVVDLVGIQAVTVTMVATSIATTSIVLLPADLEILVVALEVTDQ